MPVQFIFDPGKFLLCLCTAFRSFFMDLHHFIDRKNDICIYFSKSFHIHSSNFSTSSTGLDGVTGNGSGDGSTGRSFDVFPHGSSSDKGSSTSPAPAGSLPLREGADTIHAITRMRTKLTVSRLQTTIMKNLFAPLPAHQHRCIFSGLFISCSTFHGYFDHTVSLILKKLIRFFDPVQWICMGDKRLCIDLAFCNQL